MIRRIQAKNFRCLHYIDQPIGDFHVLVGPNASGKTTFLDVVAFLGDLLSVGLEAAVGKRSTDFQDLLFCHQGDRFELAVEWQIPENSRKHLPSPVYDTVRYEISIGLVKHENDIHIFDEQVILMNAANVQPRQINWFPRSCQPPETIMSGKVVRENKRVVRKVYDGNDNFYSEVSTKRGKGGWTPSFRLGPKKSALGNMPENEHDFPVSTWLRKTLIDGTQFLMLNSMALRQSSPPGRGYDFQADGSNLPWVVHYLSQSKPASHREWVEHLSTALPDLQDVSTIELPDTRHRFLRLQYENGFTLPSWMASDGTLRMLALTLPAYLTNFAGVYLIEEPENGVHPQAMETVYQSLSSVYSAQMLVATHSPVILSCADLKDILCFKKTNDGATDIVCGNEHPALRDWKGDIELSVLYASGVLG
ncbi:MAG: AAA family ATPase [Myxococcota bacterium]|nr:AAA family ATPase [Myxococcota bacterium]